MSTKLPIPEEGVSQTVEKTNSQTGGEGTYKDPKSGAISYATSDPLYGDAMAEGLIRVGYERIGDLPELPKRDITVFEAPVDHSALKGVNARLDKLESTNADLEAENEALKAKLEAAEKAQSTEPDTTGEEVKSPEKPLTKDNYNEAELRSIAEAEGVELSEEHKTKQNIIDAIVTARESKEGK